MTLTADTITDEQIKELLKALATERGDPNSPHYDKAKGLFGPGPNIPTCWDALNLHLDGSYRRRMRGLCADMINARSVNNDR